MPYHIESLNTSSSAATRKRTQTPTHIRKSDSSSDFSSRAAQHRTAPLPPLSAPRSSDKTTLHLPNIRSETPAAPSPMRARPPIGQRLRSSPLDDPPCCLVEASESSGIGEPRRWYRPGRPSGARTCPRIYGSCTFRTRCRRGGAKHQRRQGRRRWIPERAGRACRWERSRRTRRSGRP